MKTNSTFILVACIIMLASACQKQINQLNAPQEIYRKAPTIAEARQSANSLKGISTGDALQMSDPNGKLRSLALQWQYATTVSGKHAVWLRVPIDCLCTTMVMEIG